MEKGSVAPAHGKEWAEFKDRIKAQMDVDTIESQLPSIKIDIGAKEFDLLMDGLRSKSIPANKIVLYIVSESGLKTDELTRRLKKLVEMLELAPNITSMSLQLTERRNILPGFEEPYVPFFNSFSSPKCRIEELIISLAYSKSVRELLKDGLEGNTSLKKLRIESESEAWTFLETIKTNITSLSLNSSTRWTATLNKKGCKALISLLKNQSRSLTNFEFKCNVEDTKDLLICLSKINTLTRLKWINKCKLNGELLAAILDNNPNLEELRFRAGDLNKPKAVVKSLAALCQNQLRILKLNLENTAVLVPALENSKSITGLLLNEHSLSYQKTIATIGTMKKLKKLTLVRSDRAQTFFPMMGMADAPEGPLQNTAQDLKADLTPLISANSPLKHLKITNYSFAPSEEFFEVLQKNTSLSVLELQSEYQQKATEFLAAVRMNPILTILWSKHLSDTRLEMALVMQRNKVLLKLLQNCLTVLQTILLSKDRGFFANIPNEVMFHIFRHYTDLKFTPIQMVGIFDAASKHEWIFENANTRDKLRTLWQSVMTAKVSNMKKQSFLNISLDPQSTELKK